ncbi:aminoglycoside 6-adenylyltransferase [Cohnella sp.]|uniref:aminoglycoside 6-adenylyltransferase n=1 Tax=Cohnella sp. TaxID=1883426 RepID=UPI003567C429
MRKETEIETELLHFAQADEKVMAVILNGSRVNPNVTKDLLCDYDVIFVVTDPKNYLVHQDWINNFGGLIMMQQNNIETESEDEYIFLMLFTDGVRIDLSFRRVETINQHFNDSLTKVLLDKDNCLKNFEPPSEKSYLTLQPTKEEFDKKINNILWCSTNVAKGLWRSELPYAKFMLDIIVRQDFMNLLNWYVGMNNNWSVNTGTALKWLKKYLPVELWDSFENTYSGPANTDIWNSLFEVIRLTKDVGQEIGDKLNYGYPTHDHTNVVAYLEKVRVLPKDAKAINT